VAIGVQVGLKFTLASVRQIWQLVPTALFTITVTLVACALLGWVLTLTTDATLLDAYLATTPGGIYAVMGTSAATGGDVTFVAASQVLRLLIVLASAPFVAAYLRRSH
jgi:membrane AbrB-like protein